MVNPEGNQILPHESLGSRELLYFTVDFLIFEVRIVRDLLVWSAATSVCATPGLWRDAFVLLEGMRQTTATQHNIGVVWQYKGHTCTVLYCCIFSVVWELQWGWALTMFDLSWLIYAYSYVVFNSMFIFRACRKNASWFHEQSGKKKSMKVLCWYSRGWDWILRLMVFCMRLFQSESCVHVLCTSLIHLCISLYILVHAMWSHVLLFRGMEQCKVGTSCSAALSACEKVSQWQCAAVLGTEVVWLQT